MTPIEIMAQLGNNPTDIRFKILDDYIQQIKSEPLSLRQIDEYFRQGIASKEVGNTYHKDSLKWYAFELGKIHQEKLAKFPFAIRFQAIAEQAFVDARNSITTINLAYRNFLKKYNLGDDPANRDYETWFIELYLNTVPENIWFIDRWLNNLQIPKC